MYGSRCARKVPDAVIMRIITAKLAFMESIRPYLYYPSTLNIVRYTAIYQLPSFDDARVANNFAINQKTLYNILMWMCN